jgi:ClpP class serine protease
MAHGNTITGSIGVISVWEDYSTWLENEGIAFHVWKSGAAKDLYEPWRSPTQEENETIQREIDRLYNILIEDIARGRGNLTVEDVRKVSNGSTYLGYEALEVGLIDEIGDSALAIKKVARRTGLGTYLSRDLSLTDGEVLQLLLFEYVTSGVTFFVVFVLAVIAVIKITLNRRERAEEARRRPSGM